MGWKIWQQDLWEPILEQQTGKFSFSFIQQNWALGISLVITFQESIFLQAWYIWRYKSTSNSLFYLVEILEYILRDLSGASISRSCRFQEAEAGAREFITHISTSQQHVLSLLWMKQRAEFESHYTSKMFVTFPIALHCLNVCCVMARVLLWYNTYGSYGVKRWHNFAGTEKKTKTLY